MNLFTIANLSVLEWFFWLGLLLVVYTYIGYGLVLYLLVKIKRMLKGSMTPPLVATDDLPPVTLLIAAYNEEDYIAQKIKNTFELAYPKHLIHYFFVTDGSNDLTPEIIKKYPQIRLFHQDARQGKIAAVHRVMQHVTTPIVIYTDANTMVNKDAIYNIVRHYSDEKVGAVAGEKRILVANKDTASGAGEGFYWRYESSLKKWDSELHSVVGAAGELFSVRTDLYEAVRPDTLIEDFVMTLRIAQKGYKVVYEPDAYALEGPSASVKEELKRKIRIAAGGVQAINRLRPLLNPLKHGLLSFQYISHRVLRWTVTPVMLPLLFALNIYLVLASYLPIYSTLLICQIAFYMLAFVGYLLETQQIKLKAFFIPYYFCMMNYAVYRGFIRIWKGSQSVLWEKAKRR